MGILDGINRYRGWLSRPETQAMLGPLAYAFGAPQGHLASALGEASMQFQDTMAKREQARAEEEERQRQLEFELEDRAMRREEFDLRKAEKLALTKAQASKLEALRTKAAEIDPALVDLVDVDPDL